ncbi:MAG: PilW family protein [Candidatus Rokuibacteriota bacterium]
MSLVELLSALAVVGLVLGATVTFLQQGVQVSTFSTARLEAQQNARIALDRLAREVRQAGRGSSGDDGPAISVAERSRIVLHIDVDGDGVAAARSEMITWRLAAGILRRDAGGGAQPIVNGVRDLVLMYFDAHGRVTSVPADVRAVRIVLTTEAADVAVNPARRGVTTFTTEVRLRNR